MRYVTSVERLAIQRGVLQGIEQGREQGLEQGIEQGLQQGMQREAQIILMRLLQKRFGALGEETHTRIHNATLEQLSMWTDKILESPTLSAIFGDH